MSIEAVSEVRLEVTQFETDQAPFSEIDLLEDQLVIVFLNVNVSQYEKLRKILCACRAANIPVIVQLNKAKDYSDIELLSMMETLREWDQLLLHNVLQLLSHLMDAELMDKLWTEAKIEFKSFKEWVIATHDSRIHQYPTLPWRSFTRKVVEENFKFCISFLKTFSNPSPDQAKQLIQGFLERKKQVVCIFPKKWNRNQ